MTLFVLIYLKIIRCSIDLYSYSHAIIFIFLLMDYKNVLKLGKLWHFAFHFKIFLSSLWLPYNIKNHLLQVGYWYIAFDCADPIDQLEERLGSITILSYPVYVQSVSLFIFILFKFTMNEFVVFNVLVFCIMYILLFKLL